MALKLCLRIWALLLLMLCVGNSSQQTEQPINRDILKQILGKLNQMDSKLDLFDTKLGFVDSRLTNIEYGLKQMQNNMVDDNTALPAMDTLNTVQNISPQVNNSFIETISEEVSFLSATQSIIIYGVENFNKSISEILEIVKEIRAYTSVGLTEQQEKTERASSILSKSRIDGSLIIPLRNSKKMSWNDAVSRCKDIDAQPFIPYSRRDFELIKKVRFELNYSLWIPASDIKQEGQLKWWSGGDAGGTSGLIWESGREMYRNSGDRDCVLYEERYGVKMADCSTSYVYPMICKK